ncbi:MAG: hypothetical protein QOG31_1199 [Thermoplasmata archaeon]|jgi:hypothetical protein|nr:hypothetical protein [Thermoplasmata archaeon]
MNFVALLAALTLALAIAPVADAAPGGPTCDPDSGPFDACNWQCSPNLEQPCAILLTIGGCLWRAVFTQNC